MAYESLAELIEPYVDESFVNLPTFLQERVTEDFFPMPHWDVLTPEQRLSVALQYDARNNPAMAGERGHYWSLLDLIDEKQEEIAEMAAARAPVPTEIAAKKAALALYREELATLEKQFNAPYPVPTAPTESQDAPVVAASDARPDPERRLALLRELGGTAKYARCEWKFTGIKALVESEKANGRKRNTEKTIRADLKEAAQNERNESCAGFSTGLGQR